MVLPWSDSAGSLNASSCPRAKPSDSRSKQFVMWKLYIVALRPPSHRTLEPGSFLRHPPAASARQVSLTRAQGRRLGRAAEQDDDVGGAKETQNRTSDGNTGETARPAQSVYRRRGCCGRGAETTVRCRAGNELLAFPDITASAAVWRFVFVASACARQLSWKH